MSKTHWSAAELAALRLPGLPSTDRGVQKQAQREAWACRKRAGRGGGLEYQPPRAILALILAHQVSQTAPETLPAAGVTPALPAATVPPSVPAGFFTPAPPALPEAHHHAKTARQREEESARRAVLAAIERLQRGSGCSQEAALITLLTNARAGGDLAATLRLARDGRGRPSADGLPSVRTLKQWLADRKHGRDLAPAVRERDLAVKPWHRLAFQLMQRPQKPTTRWVAEQIAAHWQAEWGAAPPSEHAVYRFFRDKASRFDILVGRHTGMDLKAHMPYQPRIRDGLWPAMEAHADGWCSHFTAPHPVSGEYVTYEIWTAVDFATGYPTEPAIGMTESYEVIAKCLENYIRELGVPAVFQTDSTGSVKNDRFEFDGIASLQERIGFRIAHPAMVAVGKGNSQANGLVESLHAWYDLQARELATYQGKGMDGLALKRVKRITAKLARETDPAARARLAREATQAGRGLVFESFAQARDWIMRMVERRRDTPSRGLPKIADPASGRRRHMTPREMLARFREQGWQPVALSEAELIDAFRPHVRKTVRRGMVSPYAGQLYGHPDMVHHNGVEVMVAIDIHDPYRVWVKDLDGRLLCVADYVQGRLPRPVSYYDDATAKRAASQIKRREQQIETIEARTPARALEAQTGTVIPFDPLAALPGETVIEAPAKPPRRAEEDLARWLLPEDAPTTAQPPLSGQDLALWLFGKDGEPTEPPKEEAAG
jgi:putative transposase